MLNFPSSPTLNQVYTSGGKRWVWDGRSWASANILSITAGGTGATDAATARVNLGLGALATQSSVSLSDVTSALGYTPVNKAGDTFTGDVVINTKLAVGTSITASTNYRFGKGLTGGTSASAFVQNGNVQSDVTTTAVSFNSQANTAAASFTLTNYFHYYAQQGVVGAGSAITAITGFYADNTLAGSNSTYGFRGAVGSGSGKWNLYMDGTANNFLAGGAVLNSALGFGTAASPSYGSSNQILTSQGSGVVPSWQTLKTVNGNSILGSGDIVIAGGVTSFNTRTGAVTLTSSDVTTALTYTPISNASPAITTPSITGTREVKVAMAASNIDLSTGNYFTRTISGATTLTVSNVQAAGTGHSFILDLTNGGSATITWWTGVKWVGGTAPTLTTSGRDVLGFFTHDGGTTWTGLLLGKDVR